MTTAKKKREQFELGQRPRSDIHTAREEAGCDKHYPWNREGIKYTKPDPTADAKGDFVKHVMLSRQHEVVTRFGGHDASQQDHTHEPGSLAAVTAALRRWPRKAAR